MKRLILIAVLVLALMSVQALNDDKATRNIAHIGFVWAADNTTGNNQTNVTIPAEQHEFTIDRSTFNITKVSISFPDTDNHTIQDINTIDPTSGLSYGFDRIGSQGLFTIYCKSIDVYSFTFIISYSNSTSRSILIGIQQGDMAIEQNIWTETSTDFVIHFRLNLIQQTHYPSDIDVAHQVVYQMQLYIQQILTAQTNQLNVLQATNLTNSIVSMSAAITSIVAVLLAGFGAKRRRMRPE